MKNPENMTRKEKLAAIALINKVEGEQNAAKWWLTNAATISHKAFKEAIQ